MKLKVLATLQEALMAAVLKKELKIPIFLVLNLVLTTW
jgi:hypothetical protein